LAQGSANYGRIREANSYRQHRARGTNGSLCKASNFSGNSPPAAPEHVRCGKKTAPAYFRAGMKN